MKPFITIYKTTKSIYKHIKTYRTLISKYIKQINTYMTQRKPLIKHIKTYKAYKTHKAD